VQVVRHSVLYDFYHVGIFRYVPTSAVRLAYLACVALPLLGIHLDETAGQRAPRPEPGGWLHGLHTVIWGGVIAGSALMAYLAFHYAFVSVWCFFAAVLSVFLIGEFRRLRSSSERAPLTARVDCHS